MTIARTWLARHAVAAYVALTFVISWGGVLLVIGGPAGMTGVRAQDNPLFPLSLLAMVAGPAAAGVTLTALLEGRAGLRGLRSRLLAWRVERRWYAVALLAAPVLATSVALLLALVSREFLPAVVVTDDRGALLGLGLVVGLAAGVFEEIGWTGFAIPQLRRQHGPLATGVILGIVWSAWHALVVAWGIGDRAGTIPLPVFMILDGLAGLPAFRVLMVWVYERTESVLVAMVMHASLTACVLTIVPLTTGWLLLTYGLAFAAAVWITLAASSAYAVEASDGASRA